MSELDEEDRAAFEAAAESLAEREGWSSQLTWLGLPWRWSVVYTREGEAPALAYLVPDPRGPRVCVPVPASGEGAPDPAKMTKPVRTVLERSAIIAGYIWADWACSEFDPVAAEGLLASRSGS